MREKWKLAYISTERIIMPRSGNNIYMGFKLTLEELNIFSKCRHYRLSIWQCPQFLFLIMGLVIIATALVTYGLGTRYYVADPNTVSLIVFVITIILFVLTFSIVRSMEGLAEANMLKSEFVSIVSHQLRSPLSNLKWAAEILFSEKFGDLGQKQKEYLTILQDNYGRMNELINDLIMVSRIEEGQLSLNKTKFSLRDLTEEVARDLKILADASNVKINIEEQGEMPEVSGDVKMIKVAVENLLDNAIRYIKERGEVFVKFKNKGNNLLFEIKDTGVGIPEEDQRNIFQKFFRSKNALKYQTQGSGLGLHIAKYIIEKSGGKIWFKSKENKGSTFWFTLPIRNH